MIRSRASRQVPSVKARQPPGSLASSNRFLDDKVNRAVAIFWSFIIDLILVLGFCLCQRSIEDKKCLFFFLQLKVNKSIWCCGFNHLFNAKLCLKCSGIIKWIFLKLIFFSPFGNFTSKEKSSNEQERRFAGFKQKGWLGWVHYSGRTGGARNTLVTLILSLPFEKIWVSSYDKVMTHDLDL